MGLWKYSLREEPLLVQDSNPSSSRWTLHRSKLFCGIYTAFLLAAVPIKAKTTISAEDYHRLFLKMRCNDTIAQHLKVITQEPHVASTPENFATADYVLSTFHNSGLDAHYTDYEVLLTYPLSRSLSLALPQGEVIQLKLKEQEIESDPSTKNAKVIHTFHSYSPSADISAEVVFVNYGREEDYSTLRDMGLDAKGAIVIAKYGKSFRGDIVEIAAGAGAVGVMIYSDPRDYGGNRTQGYYPDSTWLPPSGVQRGSIYQEIGDPNARLAQSP